MPYGTWIIREIESPKGYALSEEEIAVTIGKVDEVVEIELVNYFIKGNIALTKVDEDYPDNKLSGAVFEVYSDTNGDGKPRLKHPKKVRRDLLTRRERGEKIQDAGFCVEQRWKPQRLPRPFPEARCLYRRRGGRCSACFAEVGIAIAQLSGDYVEDRLALSREAIEIKRGLLLS